MLITDGAATVSDEGKALLLTCAGDSRCLVLKKNNYNCTVRTVSINRVNFDDNCNLNNLLIYLGEGQYDTTTAAKTKVKTMLNKVTLILLYYGAVANKNTKQT